MTGTQEEHTATKYANSIDAARRRFAAGVTGQVDVEHLLEELSASLEQQMALIEKLRRHFEDERRRS